MTRRFTVLVEVCGALILAAYLLTRQWLYPVQGIAYIGTHRQRPGYLSTMQDWHEHAAAQAAGAEALTSAVVTRVILRPPVLPRRVPGKSLVDNVPPEQELTILAEVGQAKGWLVRPAIGYAEITS